MLLLRDPRQRALSAVAASNAVDGADSLRHIYLILLRELKLIFLVFAVFVAVAAAIVFFMPPSYTAATTLLIDPRAGPVFNNNQFQFQIGPSDPAIIDSQVEIMRSEHIARLVIDKLNLKDDPELLRDERLPNAALRYLLSLAGYERQPSEHERQQQVLQSFQRRIDVQRSQQTFIVDVSFRSHDPERAARVANGIAGAYLIDRLQARFDTTRVANTWLNDRIKTLRDAAVAADTKVEAYKTAHQIIGAGTTLVNEKELSDITSQLVQARAATAESQVRHERMRAVVDSRNVDSAMTTDILNNPVIQKLRTDYGDLSRKEADLAIRFEPTHHALTQARQQIGEIRRLIFEEYARIADTVRNDLEVARGREKAIAGRMRMVTNLTTSTNEAHVQLRELMREANSSRTVYENFLQRFTEMTQQESLPTTETRIVTAATPPPLPSHPRKLLILALASGAGLAFGIGAVLLRDRFDMTLHTGAELEQVCESEYLGMVPLLTGGRLARPPRLQIRGSGSGNDRYLPGDIGNLAFVIREPFSPFAETMRSIKVAAQFRSVSQRNMNVIAVTSALPREGKTTIASNLAQHLAWTKHRVLLVDADLRNRSLTRQLTPKAQNGLLEATSNTVPLDELLYEDAATSLKFLPAVLKRGLVTNTEEILASEAFKAFLQEAAKRYDFVVVDSPPILPVVDLKAMMGAVDGFVFVAEWGNTPRPAVESAAHVSDLFQTKLLGSILNKVRLDRISYYGGYYGSQYLTDGHNEVASEKA